MAVEWQGDEARETLARERGRVLLAMAVTLQTEFLRRINASNQKGKSPSRPGEYLRKRTGWLQGHVLYAPQTPEAVARAGRVRVGYGEAGWYGGWWESRQDRQRRKGLIDLVEELRPALAALGTKA